MDHFIDLTLQPDAEFAPETLLGALYEKLHRALASGGHEDIGASFPGADEATRNLGNMLRLHGSSASLQTLMSTHWLSGIRDHLTVATLAATPRETSHRVVRRVQAKSGVERMRRRRMRRHGITQQEAAGQLPAQVGERLDLPRVLLRSSSTGQSFPLFIRQGELQSKPQTGRFNTYGLSTCATVPWF